MVNKYELQCAFLKTVPQNNFVEKVMLNTVTNLFFLSYFQFRLENESKYPNNITFPNIQSHPQNIIYEHSPF